MNRVLIALMLVLSCSIATAAVPLSDMGLNGLQIVSGDNVRGMGYAAVYGQSYAAAYTHHANANASHGYAATGRHAASGSNLSFATAGNHVATSGGFSQAFTW